MSSTLSHNAVNGAVLDKIRIRRALLSVSDKTQLIPLATALHGAGAELISTGGTAAAIKAAGLPVVDIDAFTGFPEILSGRVKTLHPRVHGALLSVRGHAAHDADVRAHDLRYIDAVVVNLYPFAATVAADGADFSKCVENIDIGGPAMIRSGAKNHAYVAVVSAVAQYAALIAELTANDGALSLNTRRSLAADAFALTAKYDAAVADYMNGVRR